MKLVWMKAGTSGRKNSLGVGKMLILKIILMTLGVAFTTFGYKIYFRKRYNLINGFEEAYKAGRKTKRYAERVGLVELIIGINLIVIGVYGIIIK